jgi:hypothetical protein
MIFENKVNEYIIELKNDGILIDADITGVNEDLKTSKCVGRFLENGVIEEKNIYIYEDKGSLTWNIINIIKQEN